MTVKGYPRVKTVRGSPRNDRAYVTACRKDIVKGSITHLAVGVVSPAYASNGVQTPRGVQMTLTQCENYARAILAKLKQSRAYNKRLARERRKRARLER